MVKKITPKLHPFDYKEKKGKTPTAKDYDTVIDEDCDIYKGGELVCSYRKLPQEQLEVLSACSNRAKCAKSNRTSGVSQLSAVFGALPRVACREDYCRFSAQTKAQPEIFNALKPIASYLWSFYKENYPSAAASLSGFAEKIDNDWKKTGTPFTTVNVNKNFSIGYHKDAGNLNGVFSNVLITKRNTQGGYFVMPEFRVALKQSHGAMVIVDGVNIPHGVTEIIPTSKQWERSSIVFYTLSNLQHCLSKTDELKRSKAITTERARKRAIGNEELQKARGSRN